MPTQKEVSEFIASQKSILFYVKFKKALEHVLLKMPDEDYYSLTDNLILMVLHEGALGQVMHFPPKKSKFKILQFTVPNSIPDDVLRFAIAHEFGHVKQERNWQEIDSPTLEENADKAAEKFGFPKTDSIDKWIKNHRNKLGFYSTDQ